MGKSRVFYVKKNMITGIINRVIILGLPFIIRTIIIRTLGIEYLGLSSLFSSILQVLNMAELGFSSAVVFSLYKPMAEGDSDIICALLFFYKKVYKIIGIVILIAGEILIPFLPYLIHGSYPTNINIYVLYIIYLVNTSVSYLAFAYKNVLFSASQRQNVLNNINSFVSIIKFCLQISILLLFENYYFYIIWNVFFTCAENIIIAILSKFYFPEYRCRGTISNGQKKQITKQIKGLAIGQLTKVTRNSFDSIVLALYCGLIDVAIYSNYYYIFNAVMGILAIIIQAINAGIGNSIASETVDKNYNDFKKFYFYFSWIGSFCTTCFFCLYQPFMKLWVGGDYIASFKTMLLFCVYFYVIQMGLMRSAYTNATGIWWECRKTELLEMIGNLVLNFLLGYFWGVNGILIATIFTVFLFSIVGLTDKLYKLYFKTSTHDFWTDSIKYTVVTIIATLITYYFVGKIENTTVFTFIISTITTLIIPNICWLIFSVVVFRYREYIKEIIIKICRG